MIIAVLLVLALVGYGLLRTPSALTASSDGPLALVALVLLLGGVVAAVRWGPLSRRRSPEAGRVGLAVGLTLGVLLGAENVSEYLTPITQQASVAVGLGIIAAMVCAFAVASVLGAVRGGSLRAGITAAVWTGLAEYLVWFPTLLVSYYVLARGDRLDKVLRAEGTYEDFRRSGMTDLRAFIMQDYLGAGFFHLLLGMAMAALIGLPCAWLALRLRASRPPTASSANPAGGSANPAGGSAGSPMAARNRSRGPTADAERG